MEYLNKYKCPSCSHVWHKVYDCGCDSECPECDTRHISPTETKELTAQEKEVQIPHYDLLLKKVNELARQEDSTKHFEVLQELKDNCYTWTDEGDENTYTLAEIFHKGLEMNPKDIKGYVKMYDKQYIYFDETEKEILEHLEM